MLKEISRIPAEGVETREGATSAMFGLDPGHLMVGARPGRRPARRRGVRLCAAAGATTLRLPGATARTRGSRRSPRCPPPPRSPPGWRWPPGTTSTGRRGPTPTTRPRGARHEHPARRHRLRQRLLDAVHEPDRAPARPGPRRGRRGLRRRPGEAPRAPPSGSTCRADLPGRRRGLRAPGRRRRAGADEHERARPARPRRARGGQARAGREAGGDDARGGRGRCSRSPRRRPATCVCAPHILLSPTYRAMHARVRAGEIGGLLTARARYGWAGPGLEPLVLRAGRRRAVRPRRLQRHEPVRLLRAGAARDRDDRRGDPRARWSTASRCACGPRTTRTC